MSKICSRIDCYSKKLTHLLHYVLVVLSASVLMASFPSPHIYAAQVKLAWTQSLGPDVIGFKVYYGTATRSYSHAVDVGPSNFCLVSGLLDGKTYYFATTAYNTSRIESVFSNEVSCVTGVTSYTAPPTLSSGNPAMEPPGRRRTTGIRAIFRKTIEQSPSPRQPSR